MSGPPSLTLTVCVFDAVAAGFRQSVVSFEAYLTFASSPTPSQLHKLKTAHLVLTIVLSRVREADDREKRMRNSEAEVEAQRKEKAMLGFEEDRRLKRERDERGKSRPLDRAHSRDDLAQYFTIVPVANLVPSDSSDRIVRDARTAAAAEAAATQAAADLAAARHHNDDYHNLPPVAYGGPTSARRTMTVGPGEDDDEDLDGPPSYGQLHGRVLGTGRPAPPSEFASVSRQDLEESEEDY